MFWNAVPKENWPKQEEYLASNQQQWKEPFGDMRQELVFIGQNLDRQQFTQALDDCMLNDEELTGGREQWEKLPDPFPAWGYDA